MIETRAVVDSEARGDGRVEALGQLSSFRSAFYECLNARGDELFELTDAVLCSSGPVTSLPELSLAGVHRRGRDKDGPVRPVQARSWAGAAEYGDFVAQDEELDVLGGASAAHQQDQTEHLQEDRYSRRSDTAAIMPNHWRPSNHRWSMAWLHSATPQGP